MRKAIVRRNGKRDYLVFDYGSGEPILSLAAKSYAEEELVKMGYDKENIIFDLENQVELISPHHARQAVKELIEYQIEKLKGFTSAFEATLGAYFGKPKGTNIKDV